MKDRVNDCENDIKKHYLPVQIGDFDDGVYQTGKSPNMTYFRRFHYFLCGQTTKSQSGMCIAYSLHNLWCIPKFMVSSMPYDNKFSYKRNAGFKLIPENHVTKENKQQRNGINENRPILQNKNSVCHKRPRLSSLPYPVYNGCGHFLHSIT